MIARRPLALQTAAAPLSLALALMAGTLAQPALARSKVKAQAVETALAKGNGEKGVALAESAVAQSPRESSLRATLGRAYLKNGRFQSASTALSDAVTLGDNSGRTLLALALSQIGSGQNDAALRTLEMGNNVIPVADLGLALALAGEADKGTVLLADALRAGDKSDKLRANLGYAYALAGRWAEARTIVTMDLPADKVDERMTEWAAIARPEASRERVASLLGVAMADDAGQPMQLALNKSESPVQMASAEPAPMSTPVVAAAAPAAESPVSQWSAREIQTSEPAPAPQQAELPAVAQGETVTPPAPVFRAIATPMPATPPVAMASQNARVRVKPSAVKMASAKAAKPAKVEEPRVASGTHVMQLGAFLSEKNALRAKKAFLAREKSFADADVAITKATVDQRQFWRVSVNGLSANTASNKCATIRKSGGACFAHSGNLAQSAVLAMVTPKR